MKARDNPFATDRVERLLKFRPEWLGTDWEAIELRWQQLDRRVTLTGRHGAGKTTFIDAWSERLTQQGNTTLCFFLNREQKDLSPNQWQSLEVCAGKTILLDGEEQLSWNNRRKFYHLCQPADGLIVTRHTKGKLPSLLHFDPSIKILDRCVKLLAPEFYPALAAHFPQWWQQTDGNIRDILLNCYDAVSKVENS